MRAVAVALVGAVALAVHVVVPPHGDEVRTGSELLHKLLDWPDDAQPARTLLPSAFMRAACEHG